MLFGPDAESEAATNDLLSAAKSLVARREFEDARLIYTLLKNCHPEDHAYANALRTLVFREVFTYPARLNLPPWVSF